MSEWGHEDGCEWTPGGDVECGCEKWWCTQCDTCAPPPVILACELPLEECQYRKSREEAQAARPAHWPPDYVPEEGVELGPAKAIVEPKEHRWRELEETSPSGKTLFHCDDCGAERPTPDIGPCGRCDVCGHPIDTIGHAMRCGSADTKMSPKEMGAILLGELDTSRDALVDKVIKLEADLSTARATNTRLNRRCQQYESSLAEKLDQVGWGFGRMLANGAAAMFRDKWKRADKALDLVIGALRRAEYAANQGRVAKAAAEANYGLQPHYKRNLDRLAGIDPDLQENE